MATVRPFRALRPAPEYASRVACVPYDVINTEEARELAEGNEHSFLHIIRPEIDLPPGTDEHDDAVYEKGASNLRRYTHGPGSIQEETASLYVYRLVMDGREQTGVYGCASVADYNADVILKHEKTRPDKEDDRTRHIVTQRAHAEPVMLTFRDNPAVDQIVVDTVESNPLYDFVAPDGVRHTVWRVETSDELSRAFITVDRLYVADGHHRCKAASRAAEAMSARTDVSEDVAYFPAVLFPMGNMQILPYNRIIRSLPQAADGFMAALSERFDVQPSANPTPNRKGAICLYAGDTWTELSFSDESGASAVESLDVGRLSRHILEPMLGITDPRTDTNIAFVGGIRGTEELERLVDSGEAELAISMYPTSIEELVAVSDAGLLMPPKSTWFEPKLRSGLLVHLF